MEALIVASLTRSLDRKRNGNERTSLLGHIDRKIEVRHSSAHLFRNAMPPRVLDGVHDTEPNMAGGPTHAPRRANVRRQQFTPATLLAVGRVSASIAAWRRQ